MIGYLRGTVIERTAATDTAVELVIDVAGVGYRVVVSPRLAGSLPVLNGGPVRQLEEVALAIHTHVREGAITLYGFADLQERRAFELLLGAHGVGPSLALAIVAVHAPERLVEIVAGDEIEALTLVPGVGRKTAMRLLVDMKSRFGELDGAGPAPVTLPGSRPSVSHEVAEALGQLGYGPDEIKVALREVPPGDSVEEMLRATLRELASRR